MCAIGKDCYLKRLTRSSICLSVRFRFWGAAENGTSDKEALVKQPVPHAELIATYKRAQADAAHKFGLIKAVATKGPKAIQAAVETAAKAAKRRDSYARKLAELGVNLKD